MAYALLPPYYCKLPSAHTIWLHHGVQYATSLVRMLHTIIGLSKELRTLFYSTQLHHLRHFAGFEVPPSAHPSALVPPEMPYGAHDILEQLGIGSDLPGTGRETLGFIRPLRLMAVEALVNMPLCVFVTADGEGLVVNPWWENQPIDRNYPRDGTNGTYYESDLGTFADYGIIETTAPAIEAALMEILQMLGSIKSLISDFERQVMSWNTFALRNWSYGASLPWVMQPNAQAYANNLLLNLSFTTEDFPPNPEQQYVANINSEAPGQAHSLRVAAICKLMNINWILR